MSVSLLFPCFNRLEFTKQAWAALMANTDWFLVSEFHVYDDGSTDGTREFLADVVSNHFQPLSPTQVFLHCTSYRSPMGVTLDWIKRSKAPMLAKLDNDTIYPPGWLNVAMDVMERHPELDCLGLECMRAPAQLRDGPFGYRRWWPPAVMLAPPEKYVCDGLEAGPNQYGYFGYLPAIYVSGLGLYRRSAFRAKLPADNGYFGFEEFMQANCKSGWILPSLPVFLLDRMPMDPWKSLSEEYVRKGWQRAWSGAGPLRYKMHEADKWNWWRELEQHDH